MTTTSLIVTITLLIFYVGYGCFVGMGKFLDYMASTGNQGKLVIQALLCPLLWPLILIQDFWRKSS